MTWCTASAGDTAPAAQVVNSTAIPFGAAHKSVRLLPLVQLPKDVSAAKVKVELRSVLFDKTPDAAIAGRFKLDPALLGADRLVPTLDIGIQQIDQLLPGEYQLTVQLTEAGKDPLPPLTLTLERRAAQLQAQAKQTVDLQANWPFVGTGKPASEALMNLRLPTADDKRGAAIFQVSLNEGPFSDADDRKHGASLGATAASAAAGEPLVVKLAPTGFPIGTLKGKLEVHSPDLKAPLFIDVDVQTRLLPIWIVITVVIGIALGFLLRIVLQQRLDLAQARGAGLDALSEVQKQVAPVADATFQTAVAGKLADLGKALLARDAKLMKRLSDEAAVLVQQQLASLTTRLASTKSQLLGLRTLEAGKGRLPASMQAAVDVLRLPCDQAAARLASQDASGANAILDNASAALMVTLKDESSRWLAHLANVNAQVRQLCDLLDPDQAAQRNIAQGQPFDAVPAALTPAHNFADLASTAVWLDAWRAHGVQRLTALADWAGYLGVDARNLVDLALGRLPPGSTALQAEPQAFLDIAAAVAAQVEAVVATGDAFALPPLAVRGWHQTAQALLAALLQARSELVDPAKANFEAALRGRRYFAALKELPVPPPPRLHLNADAATNARSMLAGGPDDSLHVLAQPDVRGLVQDVDVPGVIIDSQLLATMQDRNLLEVARLEGLQTSVVALVLVVASYALFSKGFIGTPLELCALFFWGFSADLTLASLSSRANEWAAKSKS